MFSVYKLDRILDRAALLLEKNEAKEALEILTQAESIRPDDPYLQLYFGISHFKLGNFNESEDYLLKSDEKLRIDALPQIYLGRLFLERDEPEKALECFKKGIEKDKLHPEAHYYAGIAYVKLSRLEDATREFELVMSEKREFVMARVLTLLEWNRMNAESRKS